MVDASIVHTYVVGLAKPTALMTDIIAIYYIYRFALELELELLSWTRTSWD